MKQTINGSDFRRLVISAAANVEINKQQLNQYVYDHQCRRR